MMPKPYFPRHWRHGPPGQRPEWWPKDEPWPPQPPHWRELRRRFFRRMGCLFGGLGLLLVLVFFLGMGWTMHYYGMLPPHGGRPSILPWVGLVLLVGVIGLAWAGRGLRHISLPLGELLEASERVAQGDYTVRVAEQGPSEVRSLARAFNGMAARLESSDQQRRGLLADVTHELRTPLTVIQGNLEGLLDGVYPPDEAHLRALLEETQVLSLLVDDLRTLALAESGALQLKKEPLDLALLVNETVAAFVPQADAAQVALLVQSDPGVTILEVDPARIREVLANLIANGLHYSPPGSQLIVRLAARPGSPAGAILEVQDSGPGIAAADLPHIFDRFYKSRDSGGMGLGLAIARHLVEAHGGMLQAESQPGKGTLMRVVL